MPAAEWDETVAKARGPLGGDRRPRGAGVSDSSERRRSARTAARPAIPATPAMTTIPRHVWVDGRVVEANEPVLTAFDRGFQLGDGVFETLRARGGRPTELDEHVARLRRSAAGLEIPLPDDVAATLARAIDELLAAEGLGGPDGDASVRITVSRGPFFGRGLLPPDEHPRGHDRRPGVAGPADPGRAISRWGCTSSRARVRRDPESPLNALKTTSRADFVHARIEARAGRRRRRPVPDDRRLPVRGDLGQPLPRPRRRARDAVAGLRDPRRDDPRLDPPLGGVGRAARRRRAWLTVRDLVEADEAFLSSSVAGILPVTRFAGEPIGDGRPGAWTLRARADREAFIAGDREAGA